MCRDHQRKQLDPRHARWHPIHDACILDDEPGASDGPIKEDVDALKDHAHKGVARGLEGNAALQDVVVNARDEAGDACERGCVHGCPGELVEALQVVRELDVGGRTHDGHCVVCGAP